MHKIIVCSAERPEGVENSVGFLWELYRESIAICMTLKF